MSASLLDIRDLTVSLAGPVLQGVSLSIASGQVHGVVGESGAGKSMIARTILDILPRRAVVTGGRVLYDGRDWLRVTAGERRRHLGRDVALIPQDPMTSLNPCRRAGDQICDVLTLHLAASRSRARERCLSLLEEVHIREPARVAAAFPHQLSGGMRQRILIAMAFACAPKLIIADEPTTSLDVTVQRQILKLIRELQRAHGTAVLFITHDLGVVSKICEEVTVLLAGQVVEQAPVDCLFAAPGHAYTRALLAATPRYDRVERGAS